MNTVTERVWAAVALMAILTQMACTAATKPSRLETALANMAKDVVIPIEAEQAVNPLLVTPQIVEQGREIYMQNCVLCHDADGRSHTSLGQAMYPPAMDLTSPHVQSWTDAELVWIIQNGVRMTGMPAWKGRLSEEDTWKVVTFIHNLSFPPPAPAAQEKQASRQIAMNHGPRKQPAAAIREVDAATLSYGRTLYRQEGCFMCHKLDGEGGNVGPELTFEGDRRRTDEWLIGHFKNPAAFSKGTLMPSFKNLTDEQLGALVAFLQHGRKDNAKPQRAISAATTESTQASPESIEQQ